MSKLYFYYGTMNSGKTSNLLMTHYNLKCQQKNVLLIKPIADTRILSEQIIKSRVGQFEYAHIILFPETTTLSIDLSTISFILVDEAQFLSIDNVNMLRNITYNITIICYGLKTDSNSNLFIGSKRLIEISDSIKEIKSTCVNCNNKAIINAKFKITENNKKEIIKYSECIIDIGAEEKYQSMCWFCWN